MRVSISDYVASRTTWLATVFKQWLINAVFLETDEVDFSAKDGSVRCTVDVLHTLSCFDFKTINDVLNERYWAIRPSSRNCAYSLCFDVTMDEL